MRRGRSWLLATALTATVACTGDGSADPTDTSGPGDSSPATSDPAAAGPPPTEPPPTDPPATDPTTTEPAPATTERPAPITRQRLVITGPEEVVFDWTTDSCEPEHIPDIAARAFRDAEGRVQLTIGHYVNYRMVGPDLDSVVTDCSGHVMNSEYDPDPAQFNDSEWLGGLYTEDGETIYAVVHNEYRGDTHDDDRPGQCPSGERLRCLDTSLTLAVSTDGGDSYQDAAPPPNHLIASMPYVFDDDGLPTGLRQPSNIVTGPDGYLYVFSNISDYPAIRRPDDVPGHVEVQWVCAMRTNDIEDPTAWRFWNGTSFDGRFTNPYLAGADPDAEKCAPLATPQLGGSVNEGVVWNTALQKYVMVGPASHPTNGDPTVGVYFSTSEDLVNWTTREFLLELPIVTGPDDLQIAYPAIIDPNSPSPNFDVADDEAYLYISRFNFGGNSLDRDLLRFPLSVETVEVTAPEYTFDTDGDLEGWTAALDLAGVGVADGVLSMRSTADDPTLISPILELPSEFTTMSVRMSVSPGAATEGHVFFATELDPAFDGPKSLLFDVVADGELHDDELDLGSLPSWRGLITQVRLDPTYHSGRTIVIDHITFSR